MSYNTDYHLIEWHNDVQGCIYRNMSSVKARVGARFMIDFLIIKDSNRGYVLKRKGGEYEQHAHLTNLEACRRLIKLISLGLLPKNTWMQGSCRRLLTDDEYKRLKRPKDRYYNQPLCKR